VFITLTRQRQHDPEFESRYGQAIFLLAKMSRQSVWPTQPPVQLVVGFLPGSKAAGALCWQLTSIQYRGWEWVSPTFSPKICLRVVYRDFTVIWSRHVLTVFDYLLLQCKNRWIALTYSIDLTINRKHFLYSVAY